VHLSQTCTMSTMCKLVFFLSIIIYQYYWGALVIQITLLKGYVLQSTSPLQVVVNSIIPYGDILLHSKILLCTSNKFIGMLSYLQRGRIERWYGCTQKCERGVGDKTMFATTFLATIKKNWIVTMKAKLFRVCFEDRNDRNYFFLTC
jgi:hypothetical protein